MEQSKTCETFSCAHLVVLQWLDYCVLAFRLSSESLKELDSLLMYLLCEQKKTLKHNFVFCDTLTIYNIHYYNNYYYYNYSRIYLTVRQIAFSLYFFSNTKSSCFQSHFIIYLSFFNVLKIVAMRVPPSTIPRSVLLDSCIVRRFTT